MTSKQYLEAKNEIVKRVTGVTLIPEDQIIEHKFVELFPVYPKELYGEICTYCQTYDVKETYCEECPMSTAGNICEDNTDSTWHKANLEWIKLATEYDKEELENLAVQYNDEQGKKI
jgi:hypothetical protein